MNVNARMCFVLTGKAQPGSTIEVSGLEVPHQPDVPKQTPAAPKCPLAQHGVRYFAKSPRRESSDWEANSGVPGM
jgi:hypothetical protein